MRTLQIFFLSLTACLLGVDGLRITKMTVPKFVKNGTVESVVLDCEYEYDAKKDSNLVVKWFHDDDRSAIYQWIPEHNTVESSEKFSKRVNINYEVSTGNNFTRRRALNLLNPTTELSGTYTCQVTSHADQDLKMETMIVYAHPTDVYLNYSVSNDMVRVMCIVEGVFPIPDIAMFQIGPGKMDPTPVVDTELEHEMDDDAYNVVVSTTLPEKELQTDTLRYFGCIVAIPGTSYNETRKLPYIPSAKAEMVGGDPDYDDYGSRSAASVFLVIVCALFMSHIMTTC